MYPMHAYAQRFDMLPYVRLYSVLYASTICSMAVVYCFFKTHFALMRVQTWVKILACMPGLHLIMCAVIGWGSLSTAYGILATTGFLYGSRPFLIGYMAVQVRNCPEHITKYVILNVSNPLLSLSIHSNA